MPRRKSVDYKREIGIDPVYGSELIQKLVNIVMERGKKNIARNIVYDAINVIIKRSNGDKDKALRTFYRAFEQVTPAVEVRPRRVGGSVYQIPVEVPSARARSLALRWVVKAAAERKDKSMGLRLGHELLDASEGRGNAVKKKLDVHKMAESNRTFSHYAW